jgi:hypothetical protein
VQTSQCIDLRAHSKTVAPSNQVGNDPIQTIVVKNTIQSEEEARTVCNNICAQQTSPNFYAYNCRFLRNVKCKNDTELDMAITDTALITNADNSDLKAAVGQLGSLSHFTTVPAAIGSLVTAAVGVMGSIAFAFYVYAGLIWMTARGNSEKTEEAMKILVWTTLGICLVLGSYVLADFVIQGFIK